MRNFNKFFIPIFCLMFSCQAMSAGAPSHGFLDRKAEGWYWYKDPKDKKKTASAIAQETPQKNEKKQSKQDTPFSVEWLRKNMPKLLDSAVDNPTKENVEAYLYAQRVAMDKAQRYAEMSRVVVSSDPFLDENNRVPIGTFAKSFFGRTNSKSQGEALKYIASVAGIWMFFDSKCEWCRPQADSLQHIAKENGFITKFISMDGGGIKNVTNFVVNNGQAQTLGLKVTPTTVLVVPPNNYFIVSQGMMAQDALVDRIILAMDSNGLLPENISKKINTYDRGILTNKDMQGGASEDPKTWVKYLKDRLQGRY